METAGTPDSGSIALARYGGEPTGTGASPRAQKLRRPLDKMGRLRISAIVDARFSLIVDGETASSRVRRGGAQARGLNVLTTRHCRCWKPPDSRSRGVQTCTRRPTCKGLPGGTWNKGLGVVLAKFYLTCHKGNRSPLVQKVPHRLVLHGHHLVVAVVPVDGDWVVVVRLPYHP